MMNKKDAFSEEEIAALEKSACIMCDKKCDGNRKKFHGFSMIVHGKRMIGLYCKPCEPAIKKYFEDLCKKHNVKYVTDDPRKYH